MKTTKFYAIFIIGVIACNSNNISNQNTISHNDEQQEHEKSDTMIVNTISSFNGVNLVNYPTKKSYSTFNNEMIEVQDGYGVYFEKALVKLKTNKDFEGVLNVQYELPPYFPWGNWLTVRKEFINIIDASSCTGIKLQIKVNKPTDAILRFTICDVVKNEDIEKHGTDEMWWFNFEDGVLNGESDLQTLHAPFEKFKLSFGDGTRHNDRKIDISKIVAYEINIISKEGQYAKGDILIESICTY